MKIALVNTLAPFVRGGAEILVDDLYMQLSLRGHQVSLFRLPFPNDYEVPLTELTLASQLLDFSTYDRVIAFKFPAYCVCHPKKVLWMFHQFRQVYELYDTHDGIADSPEARVLRDLITKMDNQSIGGAHHVFVNAKEVADRLTEYNRLPSDILTPPLLNQDAYHSGPFGDYLYYPSRVTSLKRQHLAVEAMRFVRTPVKLVLAGRCIEPEYEAHLSDLVERYNLHERVFYENVWVEDNDKLNMIANSLALIYIPYKEDSCGFVTHEGFYSAKPVLTCTDSGGTVEFITDGFSGYFSEPTPQDLAEKMDLLYLNREKTEEMGRNAKEYILQCNITWDETIRRLLT